MKWIQWFVTELQRALLELTRLFATPIFEIGNSRYSLSQLLTVLLVLFAVFWVSRFLSNWIKRRVLTRMGVKRGTREVVAAFIRYLFTLVGCLVVLQTAGVNLSSITLLAGVLGIGFAFGFQNLASNFISGITLLLEQPIQVGDFIEVDELSGTVENISIRSTIVRTLDGVFVIVPNIRFVENNVINWSYRDPRCRIHISVGVDYGSDTLLVSEALLAAARQESRVVNDPTPKVWFCRFGDSALEFKLLVWINKPEESEPIRSALNFLIDRELRHRGIRIPFPQRNLHIQNIEELAAWLPAVNPAETQKPIPLAETPPVPAPSADLGQPNNQDNLTPALNNLTLRELLRRISYFERCSDMELLQLIEYGYRQLFPAEQVVCEEGSPGDSFYIILKGSVEIFSRRVEQYIATLNEGEFFGEMSLLMGIPRSATVRTLEDSVLFIIERKDLQRLLEHHPGLADQIAHKLLERQQTLQDMGILSALSEDSPLERIRRRLQTLFGI